MPPILPTVTHGFTALCLYAACRGTARAGEGNWYGGAAASLSMVYVMKYFDPKDTGNSWNNGQDFYVVRYNISIGDGIRPKETRAGMFSPSIHVAGPATHVLVEHNIIHANAKAGC